MVQQGRRRVETGGVPSGGTLRIPRNRERCRDKARLGAPGRTSEESDFFSILPNIIVLSLTAISHTLHKFQAL
jgi:hypothetical protein